MKILKQLCLLLLILVFSNCLEKKEELCVINGTVINSDAESIILVKPNQDMSYDPIIEIPVIDGKFHYQTKLNSPEAVTLLFGKAKMNGGNSMPLFLENETINLTIYSEENFEKNRVEGGKLNAEYLKFKKVAELKFKDRGKLLQDSIKVLWEHDAYHSDTMTVVYSELRLAKNHDEKIVIYRKIENLKNIGQDLSPKARLLNNKLKQLIEDKNQSQQKYLEEHPTIVSYFFFLEDLIYNKKTIDINIAKSNYKTLSESNSNHPYNTLASALINAIENIKIGKKYIDFSAPDLKGASVKLSDKVKGKVALLDFWGTWCGPCIAKSRTMVSVYNDYKDKGFTVVGVAGEFKNTDKLVRFLDQEKWPWLNLVELDRQNDIWKKYSIRGGGEIFLIDEQGIIIAKDPTAEEVRSALESRLN